MKLIIAGGRDFLDFTFLERKLERILSNTLPADIEIVSGKARGADSLGEQYAEARDIPVKAFHADWNTHGKAAGYRRNAEMAAYATHLVAFWDGKSRGTEHMINLARDKGLKVKVIMYEDD